MQNMHKTTQDGPLTGVHLPDHGSRGSGARVSLSTHASGMHRGVGKRTWQRHRWLSIPGLGSYL